MLFIMFVVSVLSSEASTVPVGSEGIPPTIDILQVIHNDIERITKQNIAASPQDGCTVCYEGLDCFDKCNGTFYYIHELPLSPERIQTKFTLYSRHNGSKGVEFTYQNVTPAARFLESPRKLVFIVHGFNSGSSAPWMIELRESILNLEDALVIAVDWSEGSSATHGYSRCVVNTELVGRQIALVLHKLRAISPRNVDSERTHFIGHSLGAQMGKFFSEFFRKISKGSLIGRITALDAAAPCFESHNVSLSSSDAIFIDGIHTSAGNEILLGRLGVTRQVGHIDFYVNGGTNQPGCGTFDYNCSHKRAHEYYVESIKSNGSCIFRSYACIGGLEQYHSGKCQKVPKVYSAIQFEGVEAMPGRGIEFVDTRSSSPFCK